jgi:hypothetical protein
MSVLTVRAGSESIASVNAVPVQRQSGAAPGDGQIGLVKLRPEAIRTRRVKHARSDALRRTLWATARNAPNVTRSILMRVI